MIFIVAPTFRDAHVWAVLNTVPITDTVIMTNTYDALRQLEGRRLQAGDRIIIYNRPDIRTSALQAIRRELEIIRIKSAYKPEIEYVG